MKIEFDFGRSASNFLYFKSSLKVRVYDGTVNFVVVYPFEKQLTTEEKAIFHQRYGMSFGNYMRYNLIGQQIKDKAAEVVSYSNVLKKNTEEDAKQLDKILEDTKDSESIEQQQQANNVLVHAMVQEAKENNKKLSALVDIMSNQAVLELEDRERDFNKNQVDTDTKFSEGLIKIMNEEKANSGNYKGGRK